MDVSGMTLEGFFLADYERLRTRINELEDTVKRLTPDGYGCPHQYDGCDRDERLRAEGIEVTRDTLRDFKEPARKTGGAHGRDSR